MSAAQSMAELSVQVTFPPMHMTRGPTAYCMGWMDMSGLLPWFLVAMLLKICFLYLPTNRY